MADVVKRVAAGLLKGTLTLAVLLLVLAAVLVGLARQAVYEIDSLQEDVAALVSQQTGLWVAFDRLTGRWKGLAPRFQIEGLRVSQSSQHAPALLARQVDLEVLLLQSVLRLQPRVRLAVQGLQLTLVKRNGRLEVDGLVPAADTGGSRDLNALAELVSRQPLLSLADSQVRLQGLYAQEVGLSVQNLQIEAGKVRRYASGHVTLRGPSTLSFDLKAQMRGSLLAPESLTGDLYLVAGFADWLPWIPEDRRHLGTATLTGLQGGNEAWLRFRNGRVLDVTSRFSLHDLNLSSPGDVQPPRIKVLSGVARWQTDAPGHWQAGVRDLRMVTPSFVWEPSVLQVSATPLAADENRYVVALDGADITPWLNYFLALRADDSRLYQTLKEVRPAGKLQELTLMVQRKGDAITDYRFEADLRQINTRAWEQYPGLRDLDVHLTGQRDLLLAKFSDDYLELNYPWLFRDTLVLNRFDGDLLLRRDTDGLELQTSPLHIHGDDMRSTTRFSLRLPADPAQPPFMALQSTLRDIDARIKSRYLPAGIISPRLLKWLDEGILSGRLVRGDIVVHGALGKDQMPNRRVLLGFTVQEAALQFLPDWTEPVRGLDADVIVDRAAVYATAVKGDYFQQTLQQARVTVPPAAVGTQHLLRVETQTRGRGETGFDILQNTPLAGMTGDIIQDMDVQGDLAVDLDLTVPLDAGPRKTGVDVDVQVRNGTFDLRSQRLQVTHLNSDLHFDLDNGLQAPALAGQSFAGPVNGHLRTRPLKQGGQVLELDLQGQARVKALKDWLTLSVLEPLSGALDYRVEMSLPTGDAKKHLHGYLNLTSQLKGTRVDLPAPFGKVASTPRAFRVWQSVNREPSLFSVRYDDQFELSLQRRKGRLQKGILMLGGDKAILPDGDHFRVAGQIPALDLDAWSDAFERIRTASDRYAENIESSRLQLLDDSRVQIQSLVVGKRALGALTLRVNRQQNTWQVQVDGDTLAGTARVPEYVFLGARHFTERDRPMQVNLTHVRLPDKDDAEDEDEVWVPSGLSPLSLPNTQLVIEDLQLGDGSFGHWELSLQRTPQGMALNDIRARMRAVELRASGEWRDNSGVRSSQVTGQFTSSNLADVMRAWGTTPTMSSREMQGQLDLRWPGAPFEFALKRAVGPFSLSLQNGEFYNVRSGVVGKFWGALNFETLTRRLSLDFKDLSEREMVYDRIDARAELDNGRVHVKTVTLDSPAIKLSSQGDLNLHTSELDMTMKVTVPVTRNLVIPAAAIGGVPAAATVYVIEKVLGNQFDKLTSLNYTVKGSIDEPKVEMVSLLNIIPGQVRDAVLGNGSKPASAPPSGGTSP